MFEQFLMQDSADNEHTDELSCMFKHGNTAALVIQNISRIVDVVSHKEICLVASFTSTPFGPGCPGGPTPPGEPLGPKAPMSPCI